MNIEEISYPRKTATVQSISISICLFVCSFSVHLFYLNIAIRLERCGCSNNHKIKINLNENLVT